VLAADPRQEEYRDRHLKRSWVEVNIDASAESSVHLTVAPPLRWRRGTISASTAMDLIDAAAEERTVTEALRRLHPTGLLSSVEDWKRYRDALSAPDDLTGSLTHRLRSLGVTSGLLRAIGAALQDEDLESDGRDYISDKWSKTLHITTVSMRSEITMDTWTDAADSFLDQTRRAPVDRPITGVPEGGIRNRRLENPGYWRTDKLVWYRRSEEPHDRDFGKNPWGQSDAICRTCQRFHGDCYRLGLDHPDDLTARSPVRSAIGFVVIDVAPSGAERDQIARQRDARIGVAA
jgi:hypothetical protein